MKTDLIPYENEKNDAFSNILQFYEKADISLNAEEEKILSRWIHADALMRGRRQKFDDMVDDLVKVFSISKFTAQNDLRQAQALFGQTRILSKNYLLGRHIESIQLKIQQAESDKSLALILPKLYAELTRAINSLPQETAKKPQTAPIIFIGSLNMQTDKPGLSIEEAKQKWKERKQKNSQKEYTDFEDVPEDDK